jgi:hypothetical protein
MPCYLMRSRTLMRTDPVKYPHDVHTPSALHQRSVPPRWESQPERGKARPDTQRGLEGGVMAYLTKTQEGTGLPPSDTRSHSAAAPSPLAS